MLVLVQVDESSKELSADALETRMFEIHQGKSCFVLEVITFPVNRKLIHWVLDFCREKLSFIKSMPSLIQS